MAQAPVDPTSQARGETARGEAGYSLVETLIAGLIFLVIVVGVLPLFISSISNNVAGNDYLHGSNFARSDLEQYLKLPFTDPGLAITGTSSATSDYWAQNPALTGVGLWVASPTAAPSGQPLLWSRTATVRQYSVDAFADGNLTVDEALDGGTDPIYVHLKEIRVQVVNDRQATGLGIGRQMTFRVLKAF